MDNPKLLSKLQRHPHVGAAGRAGTCRFFGPGIANIMAAPSLSWRGKIPTPEVSTPFFPSKLCTCLAIALLWMTSWEAPSPPLPGESKVVPCRSQEQFSAYNFLPSRGCYLSIHYDQLESFLDTCLENSPLAWSDGGTRTLGLADSCKTSWWPAQMAGVLNCKNDGKKPCCQLQCQQGGG